LPRGWSLVESRHLSVVLAVITAAVAAVYVAQVVTPLRIEFDSTEYLVIAGWIADGRGIPSGASFPSGLPLEIAGLDAIGAARSWGIVLMNTAFLAIGLGALASMLRRDLRYRGAVILAVVLSMLLSSSTIRWSSHPLSEPSFIGTSFLALAFASAARRKRSLLLGGAAVLSTVASIAIRTFGIALVPALLVVLWGLLNARQRRIALPAVAVLGVGALVALGPTRYFREAGHNWGPNPFSHFFGHLADLSRALGELVLNVPFERAPESTRWAYYVVGVAAVALVAYGARRISGRSPILLSYLVSAGALLVAWPLVDKRLLLPTLPVLTMCAGEALVRLGRLVRVLAGAWLVGFVAIGVVALVVTTRISFAGDRFPDEYATSNAVMDATYRVAWGTATAADRKLADSRALWALRRFEPRAIGAPGPTPRP
jgi:hypothetical protein